MKKTLYFASGKEVPDRLRRKYFGMVKKLRRRGCSMAMVEVDGKIATVPITSAEAALFSVTKQLRGKFHGLVICVG